jgi:hypothetical protein
MSGSKNSIKLGKKKPAANKKLFAVLGVVVVLAGGFKLAPGLLGGGGSVPVFHPPSNFHIVRTTPTIPGSGKAGPVGDPSRDPFGAPPGYGSGR